MCTVTIVPLGGETFRLACNRDESRRRPVAHPPRVRMCGMYRCVMPIDPVADGTWIGANERGLVLTLLNVNPGRGAGGVRPPGLQSRGTIIPRLLAAEDAPVVVETARRLDVTRFPPFRVVALDGTRVFEIRSDGARIDVREEERHCSRAVARGEGGARPFLFTSSGLGDHLVDGPRRALFTECFSRDEPPTALQDSFHRHGWPDRPDISVCMSRPDARTVSYTIVERMRDEIRLCYHPEAPDRPSTPMEVLLPIRLASAP